MTEYICTAWLQINNLCQKDVCVFVCFYWKLTADLTEEEGDIFSSLSQTRQSSTPTHPLLFFNHIGLFYFGWRSGLSGVNTFVSWGLRCAISSITLDCLLSCSQRSSLPGCTEKNYLVSQFSIQFNMLYWHKCLVNNIAKASRIRIRIIIMSLTVNLLVSILLAPSVNTLPLHFNFQWHCRKHLTQR